MSQLTISQADQALAAFTDSLPARVVEAFREEVDEAREKAYALAAKAHDECYRAANGLADDVRNGIGELREEFRQLTEKARLAETPSREIASELQSLRGRQRQLRRQADDVGRAMEQLRTIEADPVGWVDATLYSKFPLIRPEFTF